MKKEKNHYRKNNTKKRIELIYIKRENVYQTSSERERERERGKKIIMGPRKEIYQVHR